MTQELLIYNFVTEYTPIGRLQTEEVIISAYETREPSIFGGKMTDSLIHVITTSLILKTTGEGKGKMCYFFSQVLNLT